MSRSFREGPGSPSSQGPFHHLRRTTVIVASVIHLQDPTPSLGQSSNSGNGAGHFRGHAGIGFERASRGLDQNAAVEMQGEIGGRAESASTEAQVVGIRADRDLPEGCVLGDGNLATLEYGATTITASHSRIAVGRHRSEGQRAGAGFVEGHIAVNRSGEACISGLIHFEGVEVEGTVVHTTSGTEQRSNLLVESVQVKGAACRREFQRRADWKRIVSANLEDPVFDSRRTGVGVGSLEKDEILPDFRDSARAGNGAFDLQVRPTQGRIGWIGTGRGIDLSLIIITVQIPDSVGAGGVRLPQVGVGSEIDGDVAAKRVNHSHLIPISRQITHDRTAIDSDGLCAGLIGHHLQTDSLGQIVISTSGTVDRPAFR